MKTIGLTIGPIIKTLNLAKKTRELWAASYLFSFIMKTLIHQLLARGLNPHHILVPSVDSPSPAGNKSHAGLFPDRLIFQATEGDFDKLKEAVEATMQIIATGMAEKINLPVKDVRLDLDHYLQVYFLEKELAPTEQPILALSRYLDAMERHSKYIHRETNGALPKFLNGKGADFLSKDANLERFKSLIEIATRELREINAAAYDQIIQKYIFNDDETSVIQAFKEHEVFKNEFKIYHKYIAIVQADGDNIGKTIEAYGNDIIALQGFSQKLTTFARHAAQTIQEYGGTPVYAGGDDLLFFAPLVNRRKNETGETTFENLFDLLHHLDDQFKKSFPKSSLSFGISISYYKFPLNEALEVARNQLFEHAKGYKNNGQEKNAVAFKILKHSGRAFGTIFYKGKEDPVYSIFKRMLSQYSANKQYLNSIVQSLHLNRGVFKQLFENVTDEAETRVANFFANSFDESIHDQNRPYIEDAAKLIYQVYHTSPTDWNDEQKFQAVYAVLRTIHFFNQDDNERQ